MRVRIKKHLSSDFGDKFQSYAYSNRFWGYHKNETDADKNEKEIDENFSALLHIIRDKYHTYVNGRSKTFTDYDFIIVESLPTTQRLEKINVITQDPIQLLQFDKNGKKRVLLEGEELKALLNKLELDHFLEDKDFDLETSGYEIIFNLPKEDWTKLKRNEIAMFRDGDHRYYALYGEKTPHQLSDLDETSEEYLQLQSLRNYMPFPDGCRFKLYWGTHNALILFVLNEVKKNEQLYPRKSVLKFLEKNEEALYSLHKEIVAHGGNPLYNIDKVTMFMNYNDIENREWRVILKNKLPAYTHFKKTYLIISSDTPSIHQYSENGDHTILVEGEACRQEFDEVNLHFRPDAENDDLIVDNDYYLAEKVNALILKHRDQPILGPCEHPVAKLLMQFESVKMTREQGHPFYRKFVSFTFPRSEIKNILEAFKLFNSDENELIRLQRESEQLMALC